MTTQEIREAIEEAQEIINEWLYPAEARYYPKKEALTTLIQTAEEYLKLKDIIKKLKVGYPDPKIASEHIYQLLLGQIKSLLDEEITNPERRV